ncbi:hypothetical protein DZC76_12110 [Pseudomonas sp. phDV1]|nr:hypothetical protein DZC76_12110 [Pseudomonas sp. phDV1]
MFSCSKIEQKQLNTWVSFQSAEQPLLGQFSVSGNSTAGIYCFQLSADAIVQEWQGQAHAAHRSARTPWWLSAPQRWSTPW